MALSQAQSWLTAEATPGKAGAPQPAARICDESTNMESLAIAMARKALEETCALRLSQDLPSGPRDESLKSEANEIAIEALAAVRGTLKTAGGVCDESIALEMLTNEIGRRALERTCAAQETTEGICDIKLTVESVPNLITALDSVARALHTPGHICDESMNVDSVAIQMAMDALEKTRAAARGALQPARRGICDDEINVEAAANEIASKALSIVRGTMKPAGREICWDESINVEDLATEIARKALEKICTKPPGSKATGTICDESINVESAVNEIAQKALGVARAAAAVARSSGRPAAPICSDEGDVEAVAGALTRRALRQAFTCRGPEQPDTARLVSGDSSECISKEASGLVRAAICSTCGKIHNEKHLGDQGGILRRLIFFSHNFKKFDDGYFYVCLGWNSGRSSLC